MVTCEYPIGGELCLTMCVAASSVLNRRGAALPINDPDLTDCLDTLTTTIATQLNDIRTAHRQGADPSPFADRLCAALQSAHSLLPSAQAQVVAGSLVRQICTAITSALSGPRPVDGCCQFASAVADDAYGRHANAAHPTVSFVIKPEPSDLSSWHGVPSKVGGTTTLEYRPGRTIVGLTLSLRLPWRAALDAIPYVLAHECVAHAFRGPVDSTDDTDPGSEFSEGWMDRVALLLLLRAVRADAAFGLPRPWSDVLDLDSQVTKAHQDRLEPRSPDPDSRLRFKWQAGHDAALALEGSIWRIQGDWAAAQHEFLRLSLLLNTSDISPKARDHLARQVYFAADSDDERRAWLDDQVRAWLADGTPPPSLLPA